MTTELEIEISEGKEEIELEVVETISRPGGSLTEEVKQALLQMAEHVAYIDEHGQDYYQDLYDALYPPRALVYISVVYDPGTAVIYESTSLDSLKQYVTVTAHYDDKTTEIIASEDYTLSGTLTVGTSVVTAEYRSKTKSFSVEVVEAPTLSSIAAVFTQGSAVIYDTDSLETLRQYLVVTANYSDGSSEAVSDYTLSGNLEVGTSTITVTYGDKTDTFSVVVNASLPSIYTEYDYIQCTVNATVAQSGLIKLKVYAGLSSLSTEFLYKSPSGYPTGKCIFGRRNGSGAANSYAFYNGSNDLGYHLHGNDSNPKLTATNDVVHKVKFNNTASSPSSLSVDDGTPISVVWVNTNTLNLAPTVLTNAFDDSSSSGMAFGCQLGRIKFFDLSGVLVGDYLPVVRSNDNVIGMYDLVDKIFYTSSTASNCTIGDSNCKYTVGNWS